MDSKKASINARIESFEIKIAKEKVTVEQQKKDLKLSQNIFSEKENYWEREKQRERDYLTTCKQELEVGVCFLNFSIDIIFSLSVTMIGTTFEKMRVVIFKFAAFNYWHKHYEKYIYFFNAIFIL